MKTMVINRKNYPASFKQCKKLGQLISWAESVGEKDNLYIVKMYLNNQLMDEEEENLLDSLSINEIEELKIEMSPIEEIMGKTMSTIIGAIQDTQLKIVKFSSEFRQNNKLDDEKVKFILIQCRSVIDSLEEIFKAHVSQKLTLKHHSLWVEAEKELTNILQCILQSRTMTDVSFVTDLLEYDLVHALSQWDEVLEKEIMDNPYISHIFSLNSSGQNSDNGANA